jgi:hypothetical protein
MDRIDKDSLEYVLWCAKVHVVDLLAQPAIRISVRNQTMEGIGHEPSSLVPPEQTAK